jgi:hypothetical protein
MSGCLSDYWGDYGSGSLSNWPGWGCGVDGPLTATSDRSSGPAIGRQRRLSGTGGDAYRCCETCLSSFDVAAWGLPPAGAALQ